MTTTFVLIASGILIGAGISVIWRDVQRHRRKAFVLQRDIAVGDEAEDSEVEITIARRQPAYDSLSSLASGRAQPKLPVLSPLAQLQEAVANYDKAPTAAPWPEPVPEPVDVGLAAAEQQWTELQPAITGGIAQVNAVLAPARLSLGAPGETAWSYKNKGFGAYRRLLLGEESLAWVRVELSPEDVLAITIKAHKPTWSALNGIVTAPARGLTPAAVSDLLSACLKPAAAQAAQLAHGNGEVPPAAPRAENTWHDVDAIVSAALKATNGALAQTGARLLPLAPAAWDPELHRHRMTLAVEVDASDVARMQIERLPHEMEVAVGVRDVQMIDLGRRRRIPIEGMTTHALAELIASCAWPTIARCKEARRPSEPAL